MIRSVFSALGMLIRVILAIVLIAGLVLVAFVAYKGFQPMSQDGADGMTYWQFVRWAIRWVVYTQMIASTRRYSQPI